MMVLPALLEVAAGGGGNGSTATGGGHLVDHDVFGLSTLELQEFGFTAKGPVTCLTVIGADGWIGGTIEQSNDASVAGLGGWWHVTDNGEGAGSPPDMTTFLGVGSLEATAAFCANHPAYRFPFPIDRGNIQVGA